MPDAVASCFRGAKDVKTASSPRNLVTTTYVAKLGAQCRVITVTWTKNAFSVAVGDPASQVTCKVDMRPWCFWRKQGSRRLHVDGSVEVDVFWDLGSATFASTSEPKEKYYLAVVCNEEAVLVVGDMGEAALKRSRSKPAVSEALLLSRKEHVFGDTYFATRAQFGASGRSHEVGIECKTEGPTDPVLFISVDREPVMEVKRLVWKFRGNETISVGGVPVDIFWDVHDWLFNPPGLGHAMFVFKPNNKQSFVKNLDGDCCQDKAVARLLKSVSCRDGKCCCRVPSSDFCLLLYAWKSD